MTDDEKLRQLVRAGKVRPGDAFTRKLNEQLEAEATPHITVTAWSTATITAGFLIITVASGTLLLVTNSCLPGGLPKMLLAGWSVVLVSVLQTTLYYTRSLRRLP